VPLETHWLVYLCTWDNETQSEKKKEATGNICKWINGSDSDSDGIVIFKPVGTSDELCFYFVVSSHPSNHGRYPVENLPRFVVSSMRPWSRVEAFTCKDCDALCHLYRISASVSLTHLVCTMWLPVVLMPTVTMRWFTNISEKHRHQAFTIQTCTPWI